MKTFKKVAYIVLLLFFAAVFLASAFYIGRYLLDSKKQADKYHSLSNQVDEIRKGEMVPAETVLAPYTEPGSDAHAAILPEYAALYKQNTDMIGWISIEGTKVNYPVMQSPDEKDFYLHHNFEKEESSHGAIYVQESCDPIKPSDNLTIYGHNMKDNSMFGSLDGYVKKDFWESHKFIQFDTLTERHTYEIIAVFSTTATEGQGFTYHQFIDAVDADDFNDFVNTCKKLSFYETGLSANYGDKLITLSTCEYSHENGRLVVVAKRIE